MNDDHHPTSSLHRKNWRMMLTVVVTTAIAISGCQSSDSILGHGSHLVSPVVTDPVSGEPLDNGKYRLIVKGADDKTEIDQLGVTDAQGRTASVRLESKEDIERVSARAVYGEGEYSDYFQLVTPSGKSVTDKGYVMRMSDGSVFVGHVDSQGKTAEIYKETPIKIQMTTRSFDNAPGWREQARIVNKTVEPMSQQERVQIFQSLLEDAQESTAPDTLLFDVKDIKKMTLQAQHPIGVETTY